MKLSVLCCCLFLFFSGCGTYLIEHQEEFFLPTHEIQAAHFEENALYFGTRNYFFHYEKQQDTWELRYMTPIRSCQAMSKGLDGDLWIGTSEQLMVYKNQQLLPLPFPQMPISSLCSVRDQFFAFSSQKVFQIVPNEQSYEAQEIKGYEGNPIQILEEDQKIYLITTRHLYQIQPNFQTELVYRIASGIFENVEVTSALLHQGIFWIGTNHGLFSTTTNFLQLKSWGIKSEIFSISYINATLFCTTADGIFRSTFIGYWEPFPFGEFAPPAHLKNPYHLLKFAQKWPQAIYYYSKIHGFLKLSSKNYTYHLEFFRPFLPGFQGNLVARENDILYTQHGEISLDQPIPQFEPKFPLEDLLQRWTFQRQIIHLTREGILDETGQIVLWKPPKQYFIQDIYGPVSSESLTNQTVPFQLFSVTLAGFPEKSPALTYLFAWRSGLIEPLICASIGPVRGLYLGERLEEGRILTENYLYSYQLQPKKRLKKLPIKLQPPFLSGFQQEYDSFIVTPKGIFALRSDSVEKQVDWEEGNFKVQVFSFPQKTWCISSAGEIFEREQGTWVYQDRYPFPIQRQISVFAEKDALYFHQAQSSFFWVRDQKGGRRFELPLRCSSIYFFGRQGEELLLDTPEALLRKVGNKWQILHLRETPYLDEKIYFRVQ